MNSGIARALAASLALGAGVVWASSTPAQLTELPPEAPANQAPAGKGTPAPMNTPAGAPSTANAPPASNTAKPVPAINAANGVNAANDADVTDDTNAATNTAKPAKPATPPGPPLPVRSPTAVMQVLDKVTAETLQFEAPVGRPIRYKTLVMTVKACETRGLDDPQPRPSAYLVMETRTLTGAAREGATSKRVFAGWMFANGPALHPLQHPIYDVWLVSCAGATPAAEPARS